MVDPESCLVLFTKIQICISMVSSPAACCKLQEKKQIYTIDGRWRWQYGIGMMSKKGFMCKRVVDWVMGIGALWGKGLLFINVQMSTARKAKPMTIKKSIQTVTKLASVQTPPYWRSQISGIFGDVFVIFATDFHTKWMWQISNQAASASTHTHTPSASLSYIGGQQCQLFWVFSILCSFEWNSLVFDQCVYICLVHYQSVVNKEFMWTIKWTRPTKGWKLHSPKSP